jgi:hypothetical protein
MNLRLPFTLLLCATGIRAFPQDSHLNLTFNPLALGIEGQAGLGVGYRWHDRWEIWLESSVMTSWAPAPDGDSTRPVSGFREILALRHYFGWRRRRYFVGVEARFKRVHYKAGDIFYDPSGNPVPVNYDLYNNISGGAVFWGVRLPISHSRWFVEMMAGPGIKYRQVISKGIPPGYTQAATDEIDLHFIFDPTYATGLPYVTAAVRLGYTF